ncbi:MAG TPA: maleylpyruvate isomerase family mycothiol-dependent enzyme [Nocardioidaceae bacterium]|nr:maleylpyruvate isomerase family mycothiol-dependent enzyme [Nocardioidaceae bacterium]
MSTAFSDDAALDAIPAATDRLLETLRHLSDDAMRAPSRCTDWTRGHVATHVARNGDGLVNLLTWARTGTETPMYPSREVRNADIAAGAGRASLDIETDVDASAERFLAACVDVPEHALGAVVRLGSGRGVSAADIPWIRLLEVEIHHVDLDAGYGFDQTPTWVLTRLLTEAQAKFAERAATGGQGLEAELVAEDAGARWTFGEAPGVTVRGLLPDLVAWVTGRGDGTRLQTSGGALPRVPTWA